MSRAESDTGVAGGKFLTFFLDEEEFGLEILKVREIIGLQSITAIPETPGYVRGVMNLRGQMIAVTDLRLRFDLDAKEDTEATCIIVVEAHGSEIGVVVDEVSEVVEIPAGYVEPAPDLGGTEGERHLLGMARHEDRVRMLLDIEAVFSKNDLDRVETADAVA